MEYRYNSTLSLTLALDVGGWSTPRLGRFTPKKETGTHRLGGPHSRSGQTRKVLPPPGFDPRTVQPVMSRYADPLRMKSDISQPGYGLQWKVFTFFYYLYIYIKPYNGFFRSKYELNSMEQSCSWETNSSSAVQVSPLFFT